MPKVHLTAKFISSLTLQNGRPQEFCWDSDFPGLGLVLGKKRKTWVVQRGNKRVKVGLWPAYDIALARKRARDFVLQIDSGTDPTEQEKITVAFRESKVRRPKTGGTSQWMT